jgi:apolipoprotein N-acyltransferase
LKKPFGKNRAARTPEERKTLRRERILLIVSGALLGFAFPPIPFPFTLLMLCALIPYFEIIQRKEKLIEINQKTYLTFFAFSCVTLYWVGSWQPTADPFLMISGVLLLFVNPIFFLIPSTLYYFARRTFSNKIALILYPLFWAAYEYLYMLTDASFPWLTLGSGLSYFLSFIQIADIIGAVGISIAVIYINILFTKAWEKYKEKKKIFSFPFIAGLSIILLFILYGIIRTSTFELSDEKIKVGIIQPNLDPWDKWSGGSIDEITQLYFELSQRAIDNGAELIVWPETAFPIFLTGPTFAPVKDSVLQFLNKNEVYLLTGMPDLVYFDKNDSMPSDVKYSEADDFYYATYNAIMMLSPDTREIQRYGKMKLVPFGERVPFVDALPFLGDLIKWGVGLSGWNVGKDTVIFKMYNESSADTLSLNGLVCYESIYPFFVAKFVQKNVDIITVVTNDSWYGKLSGPYQHKEISVLRAIENRRSLIRAANGGISCIINPLGETEAETEMLTQDLIVGNVIIQNNRSTFFTSYPMIIPGIASAASLWILGIFLFKRLKEKFNL